MDENINSKLWYPQNNDLEEVHGCAICRNDEGLKVIYANVSDDTYYNVAGYYKIKECKKCKSGVLSPRIKKEYIAEAYKIYYTNTASEKKIRKLRGGRELLRKCEEKIYRSIISKNTILSIFFRKIGWKYRYISPETKTALDYGCGSGQFIDLISQLGIKGVGMDLQKEHPRLKQYVCADQLKNYTEEFDYVSCSHVIEHVYEPRQLLEEIYKAMTINGTLYIETPNWNSAGRRKYGRHWRGIEAPRHINLFTHSSLSALLLELGFKNIEIRHGRKVKIGMEKKSIAIMKGLHASQANSMKLPWFTRLKIEINEIIAPDVHEKKEFIFMSAKK